MYPLVFALRRLGGFSVAVVCISLLGCGAGVPSSSSLSGGQLRGRVHGGQQPVVGAIIQLYAAGTTGYGSSATPLIASSVFTDATGSFSITGDYTCPSSTSQLYIVATGGNPGLAPGTNNAASVLMAALGPCSLHGGQLTLDPNSFISINEVTTVASVYALSAFMGGDATHIGTSSTNAVGLANAFAQVNNLVDIGSGVAYNYTANGALAPQAAVNTLGNILAACVNSNGAGSPCSALFGTATPVGGTTPTDTVQAIYDIARNPANNVSALYALTSAAPPFQPTLSSAPTDLSLGLQYSIHGNLIPRFMAIDALGNVWFANTSTSSANGQPYSVSEMSNTGTLLSGANGYTAGGLEYPYGIAIDPFGNVWVSTTSNFGIGSVAKFSSSGSVLSGANGFTFGSGQIGFFNIALDGGGNAWVIAIATQTGASGVAELDNNGNLLSPASGFAAGNSGEPNALAIDSAGNVWTANPGSQTVSELNNQGTVLSGTGYPVSGLSPLGIAIDGSGNAWVNTNNGYGANLNNVGKLSPGGVQLSPVNGYPNCVSGSVGGVPFNCTWWSPDAFALDGAGNVWGQFYGQFSYAGGPGTVASISEISNTGTILSGPLGYGGPGLFVSQIAIDGSGNVWALSSAGVSELIGIATPVMTPFSLGVKNGTLGQRP